MTQPHPTKTDSPEVWPLIIRDLRDPGRHPDCLSLARLAEDRGAFGRARYGTPLQVHNGRSPLGDAMDEALDLMAYTRQHYERVLLEHPPTAEKARSALRLHHKAQEMALAVLREMGP